MQKQLFSSLLAICLLLSIGCKKTDLDSSAEGENNSLIRPSIVEVPNCDVIDFESAATGTLLSQITSQDGVIIPMESENTQSPGFEDAAIVFNSASPHAEDHDLGTPSDNYGGPGEADDGGAGQPSNNTALGKIVVIQDFANYPNYASEQNDVDDLDDEPEYIEFDFSNVGTAGTVTATSITVIDVEVDEEDEMGWVILYNAAGTEITRFPLEETYENGVDILSLGNTPGVRRIRLEFNGSIGFDNLAFCPTVTPPPTGCTYTQGYWKNHGPSPNGNQSNEWDVSSLTLGTRTYTDVQLQAIFREPVKGNGLISLAHQLIAAKLNIANGADASEIDEEIMAADLLIGSRLIPPTGSGFLSTSVVSSLISALTMFNEGTLPNGPSHCD